MRPESEDKSGETTPLNRTTDANNVENEGKHEKKSSTLMNEHDNESYICLIFKAVPFSFRFNFFHFL